MSPAPDPTGFASRLRRDLGTLEAYAALVGILVGAGIFKVTRDATAATGPSVVLGYLVLAPVILATAIPYAAFASTPLGRGPGGDYAHLRAVFGPRVAFAGAWLKLISYLGAGAYLAGAMADYLLELLGVAGKGLHDLAAVGSIALFLLVHALGVRWFGRAQVWMCALLGLSIAVLVVPGLFAIDAANYRPFFRGGAAGFVRSLSLLFFAYAGFEALAHSGGEVRESSERLPGVFVRGIALTMVVFVSMSVVALGVLPVGDLLASDAPMAAVAARYLPWGGTAFVTVGAILAVATSLNGTLLVPARLLLVLAEDREVPPWLGAVSARTGTPVRGLCLSAAIMAALLLSGQNGFALGIAVFALMLLYALHSAALLLLPRRNPELAAAVRLRLPRKWQAAAAACSVLALSAMVGQIVVDDAGALASTEFTARVASRRLTSLELFVLWSAAGALLHALARRTRR